MFLRELTSRFRNFTISVDLDTELLDHIDCNDKVTTHRVITFNLYKFIYYIGTIQTRRFAPSNRNKFFDKSDLIEKIFLDTNEFRVRISQIRNSGGTEILTSISEDFGVGLSIVIAENLFNIKRATIQRIYGNTKRPDWKCQTVNNRIIVIESKGSISQATSEVQERKALIQKTKETGDVKIASLSVFNENKSSENRFIDPPIEDNVKSPEMTNHILRAGHYASVFSFMGESKLSKYYGQMRKRLTGMISIDEQHRKDQTFMRLLYEAPSVVFRDKEFAGSFYKVDENKFLFNGVDKRLLSFTGFIEFLDYEADLDINENDNHFLLFKDGILIIEINNIESFSNTINPELIPSYQENITISDTYEMTEFSFQKFIVYVLKKVGFDNISEEQSSSGKRWDIRSTRNGITYYFEFKLSRKKSSIVDLQYIYPLAGQLGLNERIVFITNAEISKEYSNQFTNLVVIDKDKLRVILKNNTHLLDIINTLNKN